jgi:CheY-like chemotaxis protein
VIAVVGDLFFRSKVQQIASSLGAEVALAPGEEALRDALGHAGPALLVLDLGIRSLDPLDVIARARSRGEIRTLAFVSHVEEDARRRALEAGCDLVVPKSALDRELSRLLR